MIGGTSGDSDPNSGIIEGERHVIAAAYHLVQALNCTSMIHSSEMRALLSNLEVHLSSVKLNDGHEAAENLNREIEDKLFSAQQIIASMHSSYVRIWDCSLTTVSEYLQAVEDVRILVASLEKSKNGKTNDLLDLARNILQMAMDRLERELSEILLQNQLCFEQEQHGSSPASEETHQICEESVIANEDESVEEVSESQRESSSTEIEEYVMDLVHPDMIPRIKSIADLMIGSGYDKEFFRVFIGFWRNTLAEHLTILLRFERLGIEDVLQMEWESLNFEIKKWRRAIKAFVSIYLISAKRLFDQVLGNCEHSLSSSCLLEASKTCLMSLLNFGEAVLIGANRPEWLFCLLNMHEALASVMPLIDSLFGEETGSLIKIEYHELLNGLERSSKAIFLDLRNCIALCCSNTPFANGDVHPLTRYVMNYLVLLADYEDTLKLLHQDPNPDASTTSRPLEIHLQSLTSTLETNLREKSNLYEDPALKHIFMMNNLHYMVRKIASSVVISHYFGDYWVRVHVRKFRHHAMCYERATWGSMLELIRIDAKVTRATLKVRCRNFAAAFESLYRTQTKWVVPNLQLREDLRICASETLIPAYRNFVNKITDAIGEKHIKYKEQDLEIYIFDLLEGNSKSLNYSWKR